SLPYHFHVSLYLPLLFFLLLRPPPRSTLFPYTTLFRSLEGHFRLSSGLHSDRYLQCARLLMWPERAESAGRELAEKLREFSPQRSEEHTSELQSRGHLVCRLLLEKKKFLLKITKIYCEN